MLDDGDKRQVDIPGQPAAVAVPVSAGSRRRRGLLQDVLEALAIARAIALVCLIPIQSSVWTAAWLSNSAYSKPLSVVVSALVALFLAFAGLIVVLKLAAADRRRHSPMATGSPLPFADGDTQVICVPGTALGTAAMQPPAAAKRSMLVMLGIAAVIVGWAYLLPGCNGALLLDSPWPGTCGPSSAALTASDWTTLASFVWQVTLPALLIEMLWSVLSR